MSLAIEEREAVIERLEDCIGLDEIWRKNLIDTIRKSNHPSTKPPREKFELITVDMSMGFPKELFLNQDIKYDSKKLKTLSASEIAIRHSYLIRAGYESEPSSARHVGLMYCDKAGTKERLGNNTNIQVAFSEYHPGFATNRLKKTPNIKQLKNIAPTLNDYPKSLKILEQDIELNT